jgi:hypothetical protein
VAVAVVQTVVLVVQVVIAVQLLAKTLVVVLVLN